VKLGILLPTFRSSLNDAFALAEAASEAGLDGVFAYDHLYPMGHPERPSFAPFPVLANVATRFPQLVVGPLVARLGLVSDDRLGNAFATLSGAADGRVICALGTGDKLSRAEHEAYGLAYPSAEERRQRLAALAVRLKEVGEVWIGASGGPTAQLAHECGVALNLWQASVAEVGTARQVGPVTWAGDLGVDPHETLGQLAAAGAEWVVATPSTSIASLKEWRESR